MLLTGGRLERAFVVSKPFGAETLKVTVAQALSTYASPDTAGIHKKNLLAELSDIPAHSFKLLHGRVRRRPERRANDR